MAETQERPKEGGSFLRTPDGTLTRTEWTEREAPPPKQPKPKKKGS